MVAALIKHETRWMSPSPMWLEFSSSDTADNRRLFRQPAILRFNSDSFMDELISLMNYFPDRLIEWKAVPETWREPMRTPPTAGKLSVTEPVSGFTRDQIQLLKRTGQLEGASSGSADTTQDDEDDDKPLKLYQPAHQRFYLVTASLVCKQKGLPDRAVDSGKQEQVGFVLRRLVPSDSDATATPDTVDIDQFDEYAFVQTDSGMQWRNVSTDDLYSVDQLVPDEERLPMFTVGYTGNEGNRRRMLSGFIPVGKRESYLGAQVFEPGEASNGESGTISQEKRDAITHLFQLQIAGPWKRLIAQAYNDKEKAGDWDSNPPPITEEVGGPPGSGSSAINNRHNAREQIQTISWYVLIDFVEFLKKYIPDVYAVLAGELTPAQLGAPQKALYDALLTITINADDFDDGEFFDQSHHEKADMVESLLDALKIIIISDQYASGSDSIRGKLEAVDEPYNRRKDESAHPDWPDFLFPLADPAKGLFDKCPLPGLSVADPSDAPPDTLHDKIDALTALLAAAIPDDLSRSAPDVDPVKAPPFDNNDGWFIIRCVYEHPNCGPFNPALVSAPTEPFKLASFFDPDAPGRPIRIPMPVDISPAGLRKFNKNATFMISDMLCGKLKKIRKFTLGDLVLSVLPWPFHKDLPNPNDTGPCKKGGNSFGMFCSLSIPIVTLCALILLMIMVALFDIFFRWLPLLFLCFPIPGLKGKK